MPIQKLPKEPKTQTSMRTLALEDVRRVNRPMLGPNYPVAFWRILRLLAMPAVFQDQTREKTFQLGWHTGASMKLMTAQYIADAIFISGIGVTNPIEEHPGFLAIEFSECFTCSGITPPAGIAICDFEVGLIAGAVETSLKHKILDIRETKCIGGLGDNVCRIEVRYDRKQP